MAQVSWNQITANEWTQIFHHVPRMNENDKRSFNFDTASINWALFVETMIKSIRVYNLKQTSEQLMAADKQFNHMKWLHFMLKYFVWLVMFGAFWFVFRAHSSDGGDSLKQLEDTANLWITSRQRHDMLNFNWYDALDPLNGRMENALRSLSCTNLTFLLADSKTTRQIWINYVNDKRNKDTRM